MYTVTVQPAGHTFLVDEHENILEAGLRQGIALPYSCRGGSCGSCAATLLSGQVDYPDGEPMGLSPWDMEQGRVLLCQAAAYSDLVIGSPQVGSEPDLEIKTLPVRVEKLRRLNEDVMEMTLKLPASERLRFRAGQYLDILLRDGKRRGFSIANAPTGEAWLELHIRHVPGGQFTTHVFAEMKEKALLRIEGPLGSFYIRESGKPIVLMGGGTGFAPLKSMVEQLIAANNTRLVSLYWGVRSKDDLYMDFLPRDWQRRHDWFSYVPVLSEPRAEDAWEGRTGWVHAAVLEDFADLSGHEVYMSGPPPMVSAAREAFAGAGLPAECLYSDAFEYSADTLHALQESST